VVRAATDFLITSQDPVGGWRYPHPRSSCVLMNSSMEQAWQLTQAAKVGLQARQLDAIERVLRQRLLGYQKTGKIFSALTGWEIATGKIKPGQAEELDALYKHPTDRDPARDYREGRASFGYSDPASLVFFPEVLAFYLKHRPAERLLAPAKAREPLGKVLSREETNK
jgi:hypothetical protein